jgi:hypothetical protein
MLDTLRVRPVDIKLDLDDKTLKDLNPVYRITSGSYSSITTKRGGIHEATNVNRKEKGSVRLEVWKGNDSDPKNLIGKGEIHFNTLKEKEGKFNEWIPIHDHQGKKIGQVEFEIEITPSRSLQMGHMGDRFALRDFEETFDDLTRDVLGDWRLPRIGQGISPTEPMSSLTSWPFEETYHDFGRNLMRRVMRDIDDTFYDLRRQFRDFLKDEEGTQKLQGQEKQPQIESEMKPEESRTTKDVTTRTGGDSKQYQQGRGENIDMKPEESRSTRDVPTDQSRVGGNNKQTQQGRGERMEQEKVQPRKVGNP